MRAEMVLCVSAALLCGCGHSTTPVDGGLAPYVPTESRALGLNDVTFVLPLESADAGAPLLQPEALVPLALMERLTTVPGDVIVSRERLRVVAVRFDVCDRVEVGPCAANADGSLRLVLQPLFDDGAAEDIALHAFFPVPHDEVPAAVDALRALARLHDMSLSSRLEVNRAWRVNAVFTENLVAFIMRYARAAQLTRLTLFAQLTFRAGVVWVFRGVEQRGTGFGRIDIPSLATAEQTATLFSNVEFQAMPQADVPRGFARAMSVRAFTQATPEEQRASLEALVAVDNPRLHTATTVQCIACHASTGVLGDRAASAGVDVATLTGRFTSSFDLTPLGEVDVRNRTLRALGWFGRMPLVAQRTVNETAHVIEDIEARFPPAR